LDYRVGRRSLVSSSTLDLGARQSASGYVYNWIGLLDDVRVYGRAITPLEARALAYEGIPPKLAIAMSGGQVTVSWPFEAVGYVLQSNTNLLQGGWAVVPSVTTNFVSLLPSQAEVLYRLHRKY
jgi:hypothetical protein